MNDGRGARHRAAFTLAANRVRVQADQPEPGWSFAVGPGLTLLRNNRENFHTALSLTLAGRRRPTSGSVSLEHRGVSAHRQGDIFRLVALAGATEVDSLDRIVPVRAVLREQINWASPWWRRVGRDVLGHDLVRPWLEPLRLDIDPATKVGELNPHDRFRLRVLLALVARGEAAALIVDDVDQVRDMALRDEILAELRELSLSLPVIASTVNPDSSGIAHRVIDLRPQADTGGGPGSAEQPGRSAQSGRPKAAGGGRAEARHRESDEEDATRIMRAVPAEEPGTASPMPRVPTRQDQIPTLSEEN
ncbi:hypothetical protein [Corynebacterium mastitidis]|uniref:hypothetical protein n=1 Tax=Corynebacterium mastitidis TaxID=161890 RepID=UPI00035D715F|nr:hypothetical protein [Corynebacterium mastitidis]